MTDKKVELKKIVIKIGDKELELSLEEAKSLKGVLEEIFKENGTIITIPGVPYIPVPYPYPIPYPYTPCPYTPDPNPYPIWTSITWNHGDSVSASDGTLIIDYNFYNPQ